MGLEVWKPVFFLWTESNKNQHLKYKLLILWIVDKTKL